MQQWLWSFLVFLLGASSELLASSTSVSWERVHYTLSPEPIDVVIPAVDKDLETLEYCIEGIRKNGENIRRIIVVSPTRLTNKAEWFDEKNYPFHFSSIAQEMAHGNQKEADAILQRKYKMGWVLQQLLKLYAPLVIPNISSNVLVLDSDAVFLNPVRFVDSSGQGIFHPGSEFHPPYFSHMERLLPGLRRVYSNYSGISHHMLLQRAVIQDLFQMIESSHGMDAWKAICRCVNREEAYAPWLSEYEIYFNFALLKTNQMQIEPLKWSNISDFYNSAKYQQNGYHFIAYHDRDRR